MSTTTSKREQVLEALLVEVLAWTKLVLTRERANRLESKTHVECGYEAAQSDLEDIIEEHLTKPDGEEP